MGDWWKELLNDVDWADVLSAGLEYYAADKARDRASNAGGQATEKEDELLGERVALARLQSGLGGRSLAQGDQLVGDYLSRMAPIRDRIGSIATRPIDPNVEAGLAAADFAAADAAAQGTLQRRQAAAGVAPNSGAALEQSRVASLDSVAGKVGAMTSARRNATDRELERLGVAQRSNADLASLGNTYLNRGITALGNASSGLRSVSDVYGDRATQAGAQAGAAGSAAGGSLSDLIGALFGTDAGSAAGGGKGGRSGSIGSGSASGGLSSDVTHGMTGGAADPIRVADAGGGIFGSGSLSDGLGTNDLGGALGLAGSLTQKEGKVAGAASGALSGWQLGGPWGAVAGGVLGYVQEGGGKDLNPIQASGFTGKTMEQAFEDQDLARIGSNPGGALAAKYVGNDSALSPTSWGLGINNSSVMGKALDPVRALDPVSVFSGGNNPEEKTRDAYYAQIMQGTQADPKLFTEGLVGEFRGSRSTYPPRASGQYGPKDDDQFAADLAKRINDAYRAGSVTSADNAVTIYQKVVEPWFNTMGGMSASKAPEKHLMMTLDLVNRYINGQAITWQEAHGGQPEHAFERYAGLSGGAAQPGLDLAQRPVKTPRRPGMALAA